MWYIRSLYYCISYPIIYNIICHFKSDQIISCHIMLYYSTLGHIILYCVCLRYIEPCAHSGRACFQAQQLFFPEISCLVWVKVALVSRDFNLGPCTMLYHVTDYLPVNGAYHGIFMGLEWDISGDRPPSMVIHWWWFLMGFLTNQQYDRWVTLR